MALIVRGGLDLSLAPEQAVHFFPAVVVRVNHSLHLRRTLYGKPGLISSYLEVRENSLAFEKHP
jgi:hypothetical protein